MYSVHQHWDPLKVCAVGQSYPPQFYDYVKNKKARKVLYKIAEETEEDYQILITKLESFGVKILREPIKKEIKSYFNGKFYTKPPMQPRDTNIMIGNKWFVLESHSLDEQWNRLKGADWPLSIPQTIDEYSDLPNFVKRELEEFSFFAFQPYINSDITKHIQKQGNQVIYTNEFNALINGAMITRIGKDLYFADTGTHFYDLQTITTKFFPDYRCHIIRTEGHSDATFCPVKPGLIISLYDIPTYEKTFPNWEVVYLPNQSWEAVKPFLELKKRNNGRWWVPGEELNQDFTEFVETWMQNWVGYVEETVFDVNMLVLDEKNVICNNYNKLVFDAFDRYGINGHVINFRHRYFWDGGLHCITSDVHREGIQKDYFPERG